LVNDWFVAGGGRERKSKVNPQDALRQSQKSKLRSCCARLIFPNRKQRKQFKSQSAKVKIAESQKVGIEILFWVENVFLCLILWLKWWGENTFSRKIYAR